MRTGLRVAGREALDWWAQHLAGRGLVLGEIEERDGRATLDFEDPEGQRLSLVDDGGRGRGSVPWERSVVPAEYQIRGLGPLVLSVPRLSRSEPLLTRVLGMREVRSYSTSDAGGGAADVYVFEMGGGGPEAELHLIEEPDAPVARQGAGGVHHLALRTPTEEEYHGWTERLASAGVAHSGEIDRYWFRSLYFREPNGILFEIATDGPGFAVDEDPETLGEKVVLPPFLEPNRERIVANLKPID